MSYPPITPSGDWSGSPTDTALGPIGVSGGLRDRYIYKSLWECLYDSLEALGWFLPTRFDEPPSSGTRDNHPVTFLDRQVEWDEDIIPNTIAFVPETQTNEPFELGTDFRENRWVFYCTVIGANESESLHLAGDIRDILQGKISTINRIGGPFVNLYNWGAATPYKIGYLEIEDVDIHRMPQFSQKWARYMRDVTWCAIDYYDSDLDTSAWAWVP
jgi:hypothetical protein